MNLSRPGEAYISVHDVRAAGEADLRAGVSDEAGTVVCSPASTGESRVKSELPLLRANGAGGVGLNCQVERLGANLVDPPHEIRLGRGAGDAVDPEEGGTNRTRVQGREPVNRQHRTVGHVEPVDAPEVQRAVDRDRAAIELL